MLEFISDKLEKVIRAVSKWRTKEKDVPRYADDPVSKFLHHKFTMYVISSNVSAARYDWEEMILYVAYVNGDQWRYKSINSHEAMDFVLTGSKGDWVWSNVRVRGKGNRHLHRKPAEPYRWVDEFVT